MSLIAPALAGVVVYHPGFAPMAEADVQGQPSWSYLLTLAIPFVVGIINRPGWSSNLKRGIMLVVSVAFAVFIMWTDGVFKSGFDSAQVLLYLTAVVGSAQVWYAALKATTPGSAALDASEKLLVRQPAGEHEGA